MYVSTVCLCVFVYARIYTNAAKATGGRVNHYSTFNSIRLSVLEAAFAKDSYLNKSRLMQVIQQTGLGRNQILCWFRSKRHRVKHGKKEGTVPISEYF